MQKPNATDTFHHSNERKKKPWLRSFDALDSWEHFFEKQQAVNIKLVSFAVFIIVVHEQTDGYRSTITLNFSNFIQFNGFVMQPRRILLQALLLPFAEWFRLFSK